jgi:protein O-mannosyl-transferase
MKKIAHVLITGLAVLILSVVIAGCDNKEQQIKDNLQTAIEAVAKEKSPENYLNLGLRYYESRQFEKSIEASRESLKLQPNYALAYNNICAAYNALSMWDKAIEACEQAIKIVPDFQLAKNNLNWALSAKKPNK